MHQAAGATRGDRSWTSACPRPRAYAERVEAADADELEALLVAPFVPPREPEAVRTLVLHGVLPRLARAVPPRPRARAARRRRGGRPRRRIGFARRPRPRDGRCPPPRGRGQKTADEWSLIAKVAASTAAASRRLALAAPRRAASSTRAAPRRRRRRRARAAPRRRRALPARHGAQLAPLRPLRRWPRRRHGDPARALPVHPPRVRAPRALPRPRPRAPPAPPQRRRGRRRRHFLLHRARAGGRGLRRGPRVARRHGAAGAPRARGRAAPRPPLAALRRVCSAAAVAHLVRLWPTRLGAARAPVPVTDAECPITLMPMVDPAAASDGHTYGRRHPRPHRAGAALYARPLDLLVVPHRALLGDEGWRMRRRERTRERARRRPASGRGRGECGALSPPTRAAAPRGTKASARRRCVAPRSASARLREEPRRRDAAVGRRQRPRKAPRVDGDASRWCGGGRRRVAAQAATLASRRSRSAARSAACSAPTSRGARSR